MEQINNDYRKVRLNKLEEIKNLGYEPYPSIYFRTHTIQEALDKYEYLSDGEVTEDILSVAGRIMAHRNNGLFIDLHDSHNKIQIFSHKNNLDEKQLKLLEYLDLGDFIGVRGIIRRTPRGEITINSIDINFLSKSLQTLPEKYHGLSDVETRYRQRYVDLIINPTSREILRKRSEIIAAMRNYLTGLDFLEVETPMLHPIAGGAIAKPFVTHHNSLDMELFLRIAPELYLKKLIVGGLSEKIFEINRCFRNEGISTRHNPEFTSIEIYQSYVDFNAMMDLTEQIVINIIEKTHKKQAPSEEERIIENKFHIEFQGKIIDFTNPWQRKSMADLVKDATGIDFMAIHSDEEARTTARGLKVKIEESYGWGKSLEAVFAAKVEDNLINPMHVTYLPTEISPLAKICSHDARITERFETYINGWEIANGFSELNDPIDQYQRFAAQVKEKEAGNEEANDMDHDFIMALEYGMPPVGGLGIGIDRLVMILTNSASIREVIAFPTLRPTNDNK